MQVEITEAHREALEYFDLTFCDYTTFDTQLVVDTDIKDTYGDEYENVKIVLKDKELGNTWDVLLDSNNNMFYDVYDVHIVEIDTPKDLWKYMYFDMMTEFINK